MYVSRLGMQLQRWVRVHSKHECYCIGERVHGVLRIAWTASLWLSTVLVRFFHARVLAEDVDDYGEIETKGERARRMLHCGLHAHSPFQDGVLHGW